jgi:plastocyanin
VTHSRIRGFGLLLTALLTLSCAGGGDSNQPDPPSVVIARDVVSGNGQTDTVGQSLADSFRVVVSEGGAPKAGVAVTWSVSSGSIAFASNITDASGRAAARMTLGHSAGGFTALATISGGSKVTFTATGIPDAPTNITSIAGTGQAALVSTNASLPLTVKVTDQFGNVTPGVAVAWAKVAGNGSANGSSSTTNQNGLASISVNVGTPAGSTAIRAVPAGGLDTTVFQVFAVNLVREVLLKNNFFESVANGSQQPAVDTIPAGEAVRWTWQTGAVEHDIVPQTAAFPRSPGAATPFTYGPLILTVPGTYDYECTLHTGMVGRIVVL